ncbi:uncharacterized protein EDB91DRAFT_1241905 [Suillus paluster]|uniref:uncharacterized protein n=1 Tax=Suillus paluster TaxID=48578 RepID=UPI001B86805A|nr:uncharacterized protein EDB91DRAFT_1257048 [Suillus paluster]XP_041184690.1 uncharacterized protein EDB91DRAFT_1241905 [Suillus paluster]KAG1720316.1 hypothetical protein EDB91DRAFT_1257048 [Suillus paluster]KAG1756860.1 hypothetical protein EDB91DRAFT_1241905 [Suillus paluster]
MGRHQTVAVHQRRTWRLTKWLPLLLKLRCPRAQSVSAAGFEWIISQRDRMEEGGNSITTSRFLANISVSIVPDDPECPPGPYRCYVEVSVDNVRQRTRVSDRGKYAWNESFEFSVREDWPICIHLLAKRAFCKDVLLASSGDWMQLPTSTQTKVVSHILRHVHVQGRNGAPRIYQASVTLKLQLIDSLPIADQLPLIHPEEPFIEDVGELIAAPNLSNVELGSFCGKGRRHLSIFDCHSFSDGSSYLVSLHTFEDGSLSSINSTSANHDEVLVSPISDLPPGGDFPPSPREMDDAEQNSVLEATLADHTPNDNVNDGQLSGKDQMLPADTADPVISIAHDTVMVEPQPRHRSSMKTSSFRSDRNASSRWTQDRYALWRRVQSLFSCHRPQNSDEESCS